jgi:hypothetical protein
MANVKITALPLLTPASDDVVPVVDVSVTGGVTSKTTIADIPKNAGNGTASGPAHSFSQDTDLGIYRSGANRLAITTAGVQRAEFNATGDLLIGGSLPSGPLIRLNADGGAKFSNITIASNGNYFTSANVFAGQNPSLGIASGSGLANGKVMGTNTGSANIWEGRDTATGSAITSFIRANGSAVFKGKVQTNQLTTGSYGSATNVSLSAQALADNTTVARFFGINGTVNRGLDITLATNNSTDNALIRFNAKHTNNGVLAFATRGVDRLVLDNNGNAKFSGPVSIGGTDAANTIDSYEEGTFTPTVQFGGSGTGVTFASRTGSYTKIGNQVTVYVYLNLSNKGSSTGNATIKPLPFTAAQINASGLVGWPGVIAARQQNFSNLTTSNPNISVTAASNGVGLFLRTVAGVNLTDANFTNGSTLEFQVTYTVN